ncbi:MAG: DsbE family thiol:disulfide interchange protein [Devosia sp.]|uniref:DsbE family thiol:disulfide interchange protein n=1 Tax=Devosia sp. TaxID=1871048 RepID=UPI00262FCB76|nr:DsbE family thiol:disulfide interchange protein [Devosia sp.]MDB5542433.1 DsbE family thiol:disulfide interchange protein [Devosia sp.]
MKRVLLAVLPLLVLVGLVAVFAMNMDRDPSLVRSVLINKPVPATELPAVEGLDRNGIVPSLLEGQVTVVNVFASWCIPCREEHPVLQELLRRTGVRLIGINQKDAPENARAFLAELGNPYDAVGADRDGRASIDWGVYGVPETFVVNPEGIITYKHIGPMSLQSLESEVIPAIQKAQAG